MAFAPGAHLSEAWAAVRRAPLALLGGALAVGFLQQGPSIVTQLTNGVDPADPDPMTTLVTGLIGITLAALGWVLRSWLAPGWIRAQVAALRGRDEPALLVSGGDLFGRFLGWSMLSASILTAVAALAVLVGLVVGIVVLGAGVGGSGDVGALPLAVVAGVGAAVLVGLPLGVWVGLGLALGEHAVVLEGLAPRAALSRAWTLAEGHRIELGLFLFVNQLVTMLGFLACCVGVVPAWAVTSTAQTRAYMLLVGMVEGGAEGGPPPSATPPPVVES
jgi:hypothetical protein